VIKDWLTKGSDQIESNNTNSKVNGQSCNNYGNNFETALFTPNDSTHNMFGQTISVG